MQLVVASDGVRTVRLTAVLALLFVVVRSVPAAASLMGPAVAGDNCTPFNGYAIGYSTATGRIVGQSVVLQSGWKLVGWILVDASRSAFFVPYERYFDPNADISGGAPSLYVTGSGNDPTIGYASFVRSRSVNHSRTIAPAEITKPVLVSDCFTQPLP